MRLQRSPAVLGMAGIHRSSTLAIIAVLTSFTLGMAGIHRSSTLRSWAGTGCSSLGMAGIHRSSTLQWPICHHYFCWGWPGFTAQVHFNGQSVITISAGDGRDSPLKYT